MIRDVRDDSRDNAGLSGSFSLVVERSAFFESDAVTDMRVHRATVRLCKWIATTHTYRPTRSPETRPLISRFGKPGAGYAVLYPLVPPLMAGSA